MAGKRALSPIAENRKVETPKSLIFRGPLFGCCHHKATLRPSRHKRADPPASLVRLTGRAPRSMMRTKPPGLAVALSHRAGNCCVCILVGCPDALESRPRPAGGDLRLPGGLPLPVLPVRVLPAARRRGQPPGHCLLRVAACAPRGPRLSVHPTPGGLCPPGDFGG